MGKRSFAVPGTVKEMVREWTKDENSFRMIPPHMIIRTEDGVEITCTEEWIKTIPYEQWDAIDIFHIKVDEQLGKVTKKMDVVSPEGRIIKRVVVTTQDGKRIPFMVDDEQLSDFHEGEVVVYASYRSLWEKQYHFLDKGETVLQGEGTFGKDSEWYGSEELASYLQDPETLEVTCSAKDEAIAEYLSKRNVDQLDHSYEQYLGEEQAFWNTYSDMIQYVMYLAGTDEHESRNFISQQYDFEVKSCDNEPQKVYEKK